MKTGAISGNFCLGIGKNSAGTISGEKGSCSMVFLKFLVKNSFKKKAFCENMAF